MPDDPVCPMCGSEQAESVGKLGNLPAYKCKSCGFTYYNDPVEEEVK
jgi:transposase-like protein